MTEKSIPKTIADQVNILGKTVVFFKAKPNTKNNEGANKKRRDKCIGKLITG